MDEKTACATLNEIFCEIFDDDQLIITLETTAKDIPEWDSFNHIYIIISSETRFGVKFRTSELDELRNVGDFVRLICEKLGK